MKKAKNGFAGFDLKHFLCGGLILVWGLFCCFCGPTFAADVMQFMGSWLPDYNYNTQDVVFGPDGSGYVALGPSLGMSPDADPFDWAILVSKGDAGPQGPAGSDGLAGPAGSVGPQGPAGPQGNDGPQGSTGLTGPPGSNGSDASCSSCPWDPPVPVTPWFHGHGSPALGCPGGLNCANYQFYMDDDTGSVYSSSGDGNWSSNYSGEWLPWVQNVNVPTGTYGYSVTIDDLFLNNQVSTVYVEAIVRILNPGTYWSSGRYGASCSKANGVLTNCGINTFDSLVVGGGTSLRTRWASPHVYFEASVSSYGGTLTYRYRVSKGVN